jgi:acetyl esterase
MNLTNGVFMCFREVSLVLLLFLSVGLEKTFAKGVAVYDSKTKAFIDATSKQGGKPIYKMSHADARKVLEDLQSSTPVNKAVADIEDKTLPVGPTGNVSIRIFRPQGVKEALPVVMYFHGGGWVLGSKDTHDRLLRSLASESQVAFVFVNYTPSPEAQFPVPTQQAYEATKYVAEHGKELNLDSSRLAIAGDSVGGNMTAVVALMAKEKGTPKIMYQALLYPVTDAAMNTASYKQFANGPWLTKPGMNWFWNAYAPRMEDRKKITVSPLQASIEQLKDLPAALLITDENDVLRDEGEAYGRKLSQAGVEVTSVRFNQTIHDFAMLNPLADSPATKSAISMIARKLRSVLIPGTENKMVRK